MSMCGVCAKVVRKAAFDVHSDLFYDKACSCVQTQLGILPLCRSTGAVFVIVIVCLQLLCWLAKWMRQAGEHAILIIM